MIRRLTREDAGAYRALRLEGLKAHPLSFGSSHMREVERTEEEWAQRLERARIWGAFQDTVLVGIAGLAEKWAGYEKLDHYVELTGMYVAQPARGRGVGRALVEAVLNVAKESYEVVQLYVTADNRPAVALYRACGFVEAGRLPGSIKVDGAAHDELIMVRDFRNG